MPAVSGAREVFERCFEPWSFSCEIGVVSIVGDVVTLEGGTQFRGVGLADRLTAVKATSVTVAAWTAGAALDDEVSRLWREDRYDEAYELDLMGTAAIGRVRPGTAYSPGYEGWPLEDQKALWELLAARAGEEFGTRIRCLESGMLVPKKSQLAIVVPPAAAPQRYPRKALERWSRELLRIERAAGGVKARFRMEGSACRNVPLAIEFEVELTGEPGAWIVAGGGCRPAADDRGCGTMCSPEWGPQPLVGEPLAAAIAWNPLMNPAGCLCGREKLDHKWRVVYHTIAFALGEL